MLAAVESALMRARLPYIALAVAVYALSVPLAALRWSVILRGLNQHLSINRLILANLAASFMNNVTPGARIAGEACRVVALVRAGVSAVRSTASVACERLSEVPAIGVLTIVGLVALGRPGARLRVVSLP